MSPKLKVTVPYAEMARLADKTAELGAGIQRKALHLRAAQLPQFTDPFKRPAVVRLALAGAAIGTVVGAAYGYGALDEVRGASAWVGATLVGGGAVFGGCFGYMSGTVAGMGWNKFSAPVVRASGKLVSAMGNAALDILTPHVPQIKKPVAEPVVEPVRYMGNVVQLSEAG